MIVIPVHRTNKEPDLNKEFELTSKRDDECERMKGLSAYFEAA